MFARLAAHLSPILDGRSDDELALIATFLEEVGAATVAARHEVDPSRTSP